MDAFIMAVFNTLMGMGTVFVVLIFISLIISLFIYIPAAQEKLQSVFGRSKKEIVVEEETVPEEILETEEENLIDDGELVAVLMAAIAASSEGAVSADKLIVRSVRRVKRRR